MPLENTLQQPKESNNIFSKAADFVNSLQEPEDDGGKELTVALSRLDDQPKRKKLFKELRDVLRGKRSLADMYEDPDFKDNQEAMDYLEQGYTNPLMLEDESEDEDI